MFTLNEIEAAARLVHARMPATPQHAWPALSRRFGCEVVVKHENHTPTGSFKVRGALTFVDWLKREHPEARGIATATRGNHGQGQAMAATAAGLRALIVAPEGNSGEKNAAMRAFGADLIEYGADFDTAREEALRLAEAQGLVFVPPFHTELVRGVATYGWELLTARPDIDVLYVPIGCGSGICGCIAARDALGLETEIVGVVSENAQTAKLSAEAGRLVETDSARTFADGMAVRVPVKAALDVYGPGAARIVTVSEEEVAEAIRVLYRDTHNLAEGAGAAALAALAADRAGLKGRTAAAVLTGGNIDADWFLTVMQGGLPQV